jgi:ribonuclease Y
MMLVVIVVLAIVAAAVLAVLVVVLRRLDSLAAPTVASPPDDASSAPHATRPVRSDGERDPELAAARREVEDRSAQLAAAQAELARDRTQAAVGTAQQQARDRVELDRLRAQLQDEAQQARAKDADRAERARADLVAQGERDRVEATREAERIRAAALVDADATRADAVAEADRLRSEAAADAEAVRAEAAAATEQERAELAAELARLAGISPAEAKAEVLAGVVAEAQRDAALHVRRIEADAIEQAEGRAREIVGQALQRVATPATAEATVATIRLPSEDYKGRIIGKEGRNIRAFETVTGVDVVIDETPEVVQLSCFDPVRREVGRLTMASLVADGRIHPQRIEETYAASLADVDEVCRRAAEDALLAVGIGDLHETLVGHLGALRFRTSYGQNVLAHLVESAAIAATMAAEVGADVALVTRCAFLHDIGKALTHEVSGSHALVGAELARRCGESAAVVHAIEAHHNEVAPRTLEAVLTQASDACSGGRPGARRESAAAYTTRLARIEEIASAQPGVQRVFAVQAGREVRVMVAPDTVDDLAAAQIARTVAKQIEQELTYPGQVRVTVIRESRVSEVAH